MNMIPLYQIILSWCRADEGVIAEVPELPGCMADEVTYEEALANVRVVIAEWIETAKELGRNIPEPKVKLAYA
jgi:predicted RNase H-like HicB family nuclease